MEKGFIAKTKKYSNTDYVEKGFTVIFENFSNHGGQFECNYSHIRALSIMTGLIRNMHT